MGIAYRIYPDIGFTVVVWHGPVSVEDTVDHLVRLAADAQWPPGLRHLTDLRTVTSVALPDPELLDVLFEGSHWRDEDLEKVVVVAAELLQRTTVQDAAASLGMNAKPFGDLDAACAHLGVDAGIVRATIGDLRAEVERAVADT
jgi:hypothetical protein